MQYESSRGVHKTLTGHGALVSSLKFTQNDEKCFVSGDANGTFKLWSQETFESDVRSLLEYSAGKRKLISRTSRTVE